jgi:mitochondrial fission protein ELM1
MEGLSLKERVLAPTPKFWKKVQRIGILLTAIGTALVTAPVALPAAVITAGSYVAFGGGLIAAMSQFTVEDSQVEH